MNELKNKKIAILIANGFEQTEMTDPKKALEQAGAKTVIISPENQKVRGWKHTEWADEFPVDVPLEKAKPQDYDALLLPGGVMNPDKLRMDERAVTFVKSIFELNKPIAAICHGPWILIDADIARDHRMTSWPSIKRDLKNAGADWINEETVVDKKLLTSRKPQDIPAFNKEMIRLFAYE